MISGFSRDEGFAKTQGDQRQNAQGPRETGMVSHPEPPAPALAPSLAQPGMVSAPTGRGVRGHRRGARHTAVRTRLPDMVQSKEPGAAVYPECRMGQHSTGPPVRMLGCHDPLPAPRGTQSGDGPSTGVSMGVPQGRALALHSPVAHMTAFT